MSSESTSTHSWQRFKSGSEIRGNADLLTDSFAERIGYEFAHWLAEHLVTTPDKLRIAVGRDSRSSGPRLKAALIRGITAADSDVFDCDLCTTPAMFMTTVAPETRAHGAIMVTASHYSSEKNGFKFLLREGHMTEAGIDALIKRAIKAEIPDRLVTPINFLSLYTERLKKIVRERLEDDALKPLLGLHVVVDAGNGAGGFYADFLSDLGADVDGSLNLNPDGSFPSHSPNPEDPASLRAISEAVVENGADLGVIFDPDCDRAAIVDQNGRVINRNRLIALIAAILLEEQKGATFVTDSVTSSGLAQFITEWGGTHYRFKRGHRNVIDEAIRLNEEGIDCPLAIETSGHAAFRENYFLDDGMYLVTRLICEALNRKREGQTLSSLIDELQEPVESAEIRMDILAEDIRVAAQDVIEVILSHTLQNPAWMLAPDSREGLRVTFNLDGGLNNAWFLMRMSLHDPVMPLNAESDVPGGVKTMLTELYTVLKNCDYIELDLEPLRKFVEE
ncbi:MAG: phosphomannomutase/phosphoglucomutase [Clostridia bacterium]|nr:phosphomannomutase/phosphoglucomutase [Clostridia bacterium]